MAEFAPIGAITALRANFSRVRLLPLFDIREPLYVPGPAVFWVSKQDSPMKIAIPTFGSRVSPRFDCAQFFLIVTVDDGHAEEREEVVTSSWAPYERINKLVEFGVDTVVCGGIDCWSAESLESAGIAVYSWVTGEIEDALAALVQGELYSEDATVGSSGCGQQRVLDHEDMPDQNRGSQQKPIRGGAKGRRQRAGCRGGARRGSSGH